MSMESETRPPSKPLPRFDVVVKNCDCHSGDQVMAAFCHYLYLTPDVAHRKMTAIHLLGQSTVIENVIEEQAEAYRAVLSECVPNGDGLGLLVELRPVEQIR